MAAAPARTGTHCAPQPALSRNLRKLPYGKDFQFCLRRRGASHTVATFPDRPGLSIGLRAFTDGIIHTDIFYLY